MDQLFPISMYPINLDGIHMATVKLASDTIIPTHDCKKIADNLINSISTVYFYKLLYNKIDNIFMYVDKLPDIKLIITIEYYVDINTLINSINKNNTKRLYIDAIYNFDLYSTLKEYSYYDQYKIDY